jgi:dipeptidyl aminopeptidase/acylaminoacyl peptidase
MRSVSVWLTIAAGALALALLAPFAARAYEPGPLIPRAHLFGDLERAGAQISPDGKRLSWLAPVNGVMNVWVAPADRPGEARPVTHEEKRPIRAYFWALDSRHILYPQDAGGDENWRIYSAQADGGGVKDLTPFEGVRADVASVSRKIRDEILITLNKRDPKYPDLYRLNIKTGALTLVMENTGFSSILTDKYYRPRLATKLTKDGGEQVFRLTPRGEWEPWIKFAREDQFVSGPAEIETDKNAVLFYDSRGRNTAALTEIDLNSGAVKVIAEDPRADIGGVIEDLETEEPLAYSVTYQTLEHKAIGKRLKGDIAFLNAQNIGDWDVGSRSDDDRYWIVGGSSDVRPGAAYLYDRQAKTLTKLYDGRPKLAGAPLTQMHPVVIKARDGVDLVSYLSLPRGADVNSSGRPEAPLPMVLLVHGGPWARDVFGYNARHQWLANRGYAVLSVNFRSSDGLGKTLVNAGNLEWGRKMDDDLLDAVAWAVKQKIADPKRVAIMGGSYGGYATLASMTRNPDTYACGVDIVGPSNLETLLKTIPPYWEAGRQLFYKAIGDPGTKEGRALLRERSPLYKADRIRKPLLIGQGANDPRVAKAESDQMVAAMKAGNIPVVYVVYPDEGHGFARPANNISFNAITEQFLASCLGGRAQPIAAAEIKGASLKVEEGADQIAGLKTALKARDEGK